MGKSWDKSGIAFDPKTWATIGGVLWPGAILVAFGGTRTFHRIAVAIEDAGFEIRDSLCWLYGQGFPKSMNLGGGWGTALKPAWEPIILARKPLSEKTVAANVARHGTGGINIDGCRVSVAPGMKVDGGRISTRTEGWNRPWKSNPDAIAACRARGDQSVAKADSLGRFPANLALDEEAAKQLDAEAGDRPSGIAVQRNGGGQRIGSGRTYSGSKAGLVRPDAGYLDSGGPSRFFYCAKASKSDRNAGLPKGKENAHPTVKPIALMRWLVRLVTPLNGVVLDPFCGSGSTLVAAKLEGFSGIGIERELASVETARARIAGTLAAC